MNIHSNNSRNYVVLNKLLNKIELFLIKSIDDDFEYPRLHLSNRISQLIASLIAVDFSVQSISSAKKNGKYFFQLLPVNLICNNIKINTKTGKVKPSLQLLMFNIIQFLFLWFYVLFSFFVSILFSPRAIGRASLIYGVPNDLGNDNSLIEFEKYCLITNNKIISNSNAYVVQFNKRINSKRKNIFVYTRIPVLSLFLSNKTIYHEKILFLKKHFYILFNFLYLGITNPITSLLWKDFALHSCVESLNKRNLIQSNILTSTNTSSQDLWMNFLPNKSFKTYFALYSQNSFNFVFNDDPVDTINIGHKYLKADLIWIWNDEYKLSLVRNGVNCKTKVIEPVLWREFNKSSKFKNNNIIKISIFDVTPFDDKFLLGIGSESSYYNTNTMSKFLDDIVSAVKLITYSDNIKFELTLKHKRKRYNSHDQSYFDHIDRLKISNSFFNFIDHDVNLFNFINESHMVIAIPYSSPVILAQTLKIPSFYYDPGNQIVFPDEYFPESIIKVSRLDDLVNKIREKLPL